MLSDKLKQVALKSKQLYQEKYPAALEENNCDALRFGLETLLAERHQLECELYRESRRFTLRIVRFFAKASVRLAYTRGPRGTLRGCDFIVPVTLRVTLYTPERASERATQFTIFAGRVLNRDRIAANLIEKIIKMVRASSHLLDHRGELTT